MGITFNHVSFSFNEVKALENIHLTLGEGITAVMGPNGAGKTTLLQLAASIRSPGQGEMQFDGEPFATSGGQVRRALGFLPQEVDYPEYLTPRKLITYMAQLRFLDPRLGMRELENLGIGSQANCYFGELSMGETRLVALAQALMGTPRLLIMDEPFRGLDVLERRVAFRSIQASLANRIVAFSTHATNEVDLLATRVIILNGGRMIYSGGTEELRREASGKVHEITLLPEEETSLLSRGCVSRRSQLDGKTIIRVVGQTPEDKRFKPAEPTLEDAYLLLLRRASGQGGSTKETKQ